MKEQEKEEGQEQEEEEVQEQEEEEEEECRERKTKNKQVMCTLPKKSHLLQSLVRVNNGRVCTMQGEEKRAQCVPAIGHVGSPETRRSKPSFTGTPSGCHSEAWK